MTLKYPLYVFSSLYLQMVGLEMKLIVVPLDCLFPNRLFPRLVNELREVLDF